MPMAWKLKSLEIMLGILTKTTGTTKVERGGNMQQLYKYPHTPHVPWSPGTHNDDVKLSSTAHLTGKEVVASEKMDGEN